MNIASDEDGRTAGPPDGSAPWGRAAAPDGSLRVVTTAEGLPVELYIAPEQLAVAPHRLAERILALCAVARASAGLRTRTALAERGAPPEVLDALGLPDRGELAGLEAAADRCCDVVRPEPSRRAER